MNAILRFAFVASLAGLCAGCLSSSTPEAKAWMLHSPENLPRASTPVEVSTSAFASTRLGSITVCAPYDRPQFLVRRADGSVAQDPYNVFVSSPALLARGPVRDRLEADGRFGRVVAQSSGANTDAQVEVLIKDLSLDCRDASRRTARAAISLDIVRTGRGPRDIAFAGEGAGTADASRGDFTEAFSAAFDAAIAEALRNIK